MPLDPRSRISVGIDGRQYVRKPAMYVDVLGLPTITEAVQSASEMLRRGILRAMSSSTDDNNTAQPKPKVEKSDRQKAQSALQPPPISGSARRDPVSVYSAITKRARKVAPEATEAPNRDTSNSTLSDSPVQIVREKIIAESARTKTNLRAWNSAKKAGPSILSKRSRPPSASTGGLSGSERVFQPATKREKRAELASKLANSGNARTQGSAAEKASEHKASDQKTSDKQASEKPPDKKSSEGKPASSATLPTAAKKTTPPPELPRSDNRAGAAIASSAIRSEPAKVYVPQDRKDDEPAKPLPTLKAQSLSRGEASLKSKRSLLKPLSSPEPSGTLKPISPGMQNSPGTRKLPPAWSQVTSKGFKNAGTRTSILSKNSLLRKPGPVTIFPKATAPLATKRRELNGGISMQQANATKNSVQLLPVLTRPNPQTSGSDAMIPLPSASGMQVKYVPGSEIIDGVRPNGYTVSRDGVVKPVVTFNPKPKLPHKLRQTSVEKLFEGWRDIKKLVEGDALSRALRTEQEMYAQASGRADYRAAMTVKLKEIRK